MVLDTSVVLHIFFGEAGWEETLAFLLKQPTRLLAAPSLVEAQAVVVGRTTTAAQAKGMLDLVLTDLRIELVPFSVEQAHLAREAYMTFGKGRGHRARLNLGDVMSYALAKDYGEVLAFVGDDFNHTDLNVVRFPL